MPFIRNRLMRPALASDHLGGSYGVVRSLSTRGAINSSGHSICWMVIDIKLDELLMGRGRSRSTAPPHLSGSLCLGFGFPERLFRVLYLSLKYKIIFLSISFGPPPFVRVFSLMRVIRFCVTGTRRPRARSWNLDATTCLIARSSEIRFLIQSRDGWVRMLLTC